MKTKSLCGLFGSLLLFIGVFAPIVSVPVVGNVNYMSSGDGIVGWLLIFLAIVSFGFTILEEYRGLWFTGSAAVLLLIVSFFNFQSKLSEAKANLDRELAGNPFKGIAEAAVDTVQLQWGWALLMGGAVLLITAAALREDEKQKGSSESVLIPNEGQYCNLCGRVAKSNHAFGTRYVICRHCVPEYKNIAD